MEKNLSDTKLSHSTVMDTAGGELHFEQPIARIRHVRLPGEQAIDVVRRVAQSVAFAFHVDPEEVVGQQGFESSHDTVVLPDGVITRTSLTGTLTLTRDAARIAATGADLLFIFILESGSVDVTPSRSGRRMRDGDILFVDLTKPVKLVEGEHVMATLVISRSLLPENVRNIDLHTSEIRAEHPLARIITSTTFRLWEDSRNMTPAQGSAVLRAIADMLGLALSDTKRARGEDMTLKASAEAVIDDHLSDPALSPSWIANRLNVSRATLYRTFAPYGGVTRFIDDRRLQRAWVLISSPVGPPFAQIAKRCGYRNKTHLTHAFTEALNATPETIRAATGEAREKLDELASRVIMDEWTRRSGRAQIEQAQAEPGGE